HAGGVRGAVDAQFAPGHLGVAHGGQAGGEVGGAGGLQPAEQLVGGEVGVEVGAVAADVDGERQDQIHGGVEDHAGEPASLVAQEHAAGRVGGVLGATSQAQRLGGDHGLVARDVVVDHRVPGGGLVQHPPGGAPFGVLGVVHAEGADPLAGGGVPGLFGDGGDQLGDAAHRGVAGVDGGQLLRSGQQVVVRVDEAGGDGAPAGVDHLGAGARGGGRLRLAAD